MLRTILFTAVIMGVVGGFFMLSPQEAPFISSEAESQAAQFTQDLFATSPQNTANTAQTASAAAAESGTIPPTNTNKKIMNAILHTSEGDITIEFMTTDAPQTVANFTKLASERFYDGTKFHRVIADFMLQGGDPLTKDDSMQARWGTGGPGYQFADEIHSKNQNAIGTIAMANSGPNTNGSQFFINVANNNFLDTKHTVFGKVISGMDVVEKIGKTETSVSDRPLTPIVLTGITLQ